MADLTQLLHHEQRKPGRASLTLFTRQGLSREETLRVPDTPSAGPALPDTGSPPTAAASVTQGQAGAADPPASPLAPLRAVAAPEAAQAVVQKTDTPLPGASTLSPAARKPRP